MRTIILTKGIPASGKTTWALNEIKRNPGQYKRVNKDLLREMIDGGLYTEKNERFILRVRDNIVETSLAKEYDVIVDDTNFGDKHWCAMCDIAKNIGDVQVIEKYFDISLNEAIKRNSERLNPVPENVIRDMFEKHVKNKVLIPRSEYFPPVRKNNRKLNPLLPKAVIVDVDGTVALAYSRGIYEISKVISDDTYDDVLELVNMFYEKGYKIIVVSGRDDIALEDTKFWLTVNNIKFNEIFLRKTGDNRKDAIIKEEIYFKHIKPYYNVIYAIDDRPQVCRMWRKNDITVFQLNHIDF